jgi:DNA-binding LacI/PurR family transcriptional regulator
MSISEVAKRAGVSRATVSLVINNRPSISQSTAHTVRQAMEELNYRPAAPERRPGRKVKVASTRLALVATMPGAWLRSPVYSEVMHGIEMAAREAQASVLLHHAPDEATWNPEQLSGNVDGLVLFGGHPTRERLGSLNSLPCVQVMRSPSPIGWCDHITYKSESIGYLAAEYLLREGHRHTACLSQGDKSPWTLRQASFVAAIQGAEGTVQLLNGVGAVQLLENEQTTDRALLARLVEESLAATPRPTGLFLSSDILVAPIYLLLLERGIQPGRDIQIVSCNNERPLLNGLHPRPAVIDTQSLEVGRAAAQRLLWRMNNPTAPIADILIQPVLVEPNS